MQPEQRHQRSIKLRVTDPHLAELLGRTELEAQEPGERLIPAHLTERQTSRLFEGMEEKYPPILTFAQAAELAQVSVSTLKGWFSEGRYANAVRRGKPGRVVRDIFVREFLKDGFG